MKALLVKVEEAGVMLGLSRSKVYALIADGTLPAVRLGATTRVPLDRLRAWIDAQVIRRKPEESEGGTEQAEEDH